MLPDRSHRSPQTYACKGIIINLQYAFKKSTSPHNVDERTTAKEAVRSRSTSHQSTMSKTATVSPTTRPPCRRPRHHPHAQDAGRTRYFLWTPAGKRPGGAPACPAADSWSWRCHRLNDLRMCAPPLREQLDLSAPLQDRRDHARGASDPAHAQPGGRQIRHGGQS